MQHTEKSANGAAPPRLADDGNSEVRKPPGASTPTLSYVHPVTLVPVADDIRDRGTPDYRVWFDNLVADLKQYGVKVPIIVYREGGRYRVIDGETRRLAALVAGNVETVPVLIYEQKPDDAALKLAQLQANAMRRDNTVLELGPVYIDLMRLHGWSQAELARNIHVTAAQVSKVLSTFNNLCDDVKAMLAGGTVPGRAAYAISRIEDVPMQVDLAKKVRDGLLKVESLEDHVAARLNGGKKPSSRKGKPVKAKVDGAAFEFPADFTWDRIIDLGNRLVDAAKRGAKMPDLAPAAVLPSLLK